VWRLGGITDASAGVSSRQRKQDQKKRDEQESTADVWQHQSVSWRSMSARC
jgi:hypothetical protein